MAMILKQYQGAISLTELKQMPSRELMGYVDALNTMNDMAEPKKEGLEGQDALNAMKLDPAIRCE
jgi:hypothetical protein